MIRNRFFTTCRSPGWRTRLITLGAAAAFGLAAFCPPGYANPSRVKPNARAAINSGLLWLAHHQLANGSFPAVQQNDRPAVTSLAVMAFLSRGYTPAHGPYHQLLIRAINWVLSQQRPDGYIAPPGGTMYDHGISTVMLAEVYGMVDHAQRRRVGKALAKAVSLILAAQKKSTGSFAGGWRYQPWDTSADISCTGWQLMALRGAADSGAAVPKQAIQNGIAFLMRDACPSGGFSYQPGGPPGRARTGTGIVALELMGQRNSRQAIAGGDYLLVHPLQKGEQFYFYAVYYCSQAANQLGGKYWRHIYPQIRNQVIQLQQGSGCWIPIDGIEQQGGKVLATSMAVLALCVPFHYLPLYQR